MIIRLRIVASPYRYASFSILHFEFPNNSISRIKKRKAIGSAKHIFVKLIQLWFFGLEDTVLNLMLLYDQIIVHATLDWTAPLGRINTWLPL